MKVKIRNTIFFIFITFFGLGLVNLGLSELYGFENECYCVDYYKVFAVCNSCSTGSYYSVENEGSYCLGSRCMSDFSYVCDEEGGRPLF